MVNYCIREAIKEDIPKLAALEQICFSDPWSQDVFKSDFSNPLVRYYVAEVEDEDAESCQGLIGQLGFLCIAGECQINNVAVHPDYRESGLGSELLELVLNITEDEGTSFWTLEVRVNNDAAIGLYKKFGFEIVGERPNYYDDGTNAFLLTRTKKDV